MTHLFQDPQHSYHATTTRTPQKGMQEDGRARRREWLWRVSAPLLLFEAICWSLGPLLVPSAGAYINAAFSVVCRPITILVVGFLHLIL